MIRRLATIALLAHGAALPAQTAPAPTAVPTTAHATSQAALPTPAEVIARYVAVTGGEAAFASLTSRRAVGTFALPDLGITGGVTTLLRADGHALITIDVPGIGVVKQGMSDGIVWSLHPTDAPTMVGGGAAHTSRRSFALAPETTLVGYRDVSIVGRVDVNGRPSYEMTLVSDAGVRETRFYDVETGLLVKSIGVLASDAGELTVTTFYSDYEDAAPIRVPMKVRQTMSGVSPEQTMAKVEHNVDLPDALFALPPEIVALRAATQPAAGAR